MSDLPSLANRIQTQETQFLAPVSESTIQKVGETINFILDHYVLPPGAIFDYAGLEASIPSGWICCDGRAISRTTNSNLFTAIGTLYGAGDGLTTFNVPDFRGIFSRMVDTTTAGTAGRDTDQGQRVPTGTGVAAEPGSYQADAMLSHTHSLPTSGGGALNIGAANYNAVTNGSYSNPSLSQNEGYASPAETRAKNMYIFKIIKT